MIFLNGVRTKELQALLQLMYFGEATFYHNGLEAFLKVVEEIKLNGFQIPLFSTGEKRVWHNEADISTSPRNSNTNRSRNFVKQSESNHEMKKCNFHILIILGDTKGIYMKE